MNAADLRASILQAAIEGKLVPQLESEPEVKQIGEAPEEVPFEIPKKWKWVQLSSAGKIVGGGTPKTGITAYWGGKISWVTPADLGKINGRYISFGAKSITQTGLDNSSARLLPPGSVVYSSRAPIGHIAIAENELCTNQGCKSFVPNLGKIRTEWGYFCLIARTPDIISRASGTTFKEISGSGVGATWIPLPPLAEQRRIVARVNELLPLVDEFGEAQKAFTIAQTEFPGKLKASLLQAAIEGKLVPQLESEPEVEQIGDAPEEVPFEIPKKWKWVRLSSVQFLIRGITFPASAKHKEPKVGLIRCLTTGSVQQTHRPVSDVYVKSEYVKNNKQYLRRGDVVLSSANSRELVGKNIIWSCDASNVSFGGFLTVARSRTDVLASEFAYVVYQYLFVSGKFMEIATQTTNIANISNKVLAEIALPVPPLAEQCRIVARLNKLLASINQLGD